ELVLGAGELDVGRNVVDAHLGRFLDDVGDGRLGVDEQVVNRLVEVARRLHVEGEVALRIEVDEQDALTQLRQGGAEVHGGGGLAHPPFLHRYGDRSGQDRSESNPRRRLSLQTGVTGGGASTIGRGVRAPSDRKRSRRPAPAESPRARAARRPHDEMIIDIVIVFILLVAALLGFQRGVIQPLMAEIFSSRTLLLVFRFHDQYTSAMQTYLHISAILSVFVAIILAIVMGAVGGGIGGMFHRIESIRGIDGLLGIFVHLAVTLVVIYLAVSALVTLDNAFQPTISSASLTLAQVNTLESWIQSNPITSAMVSKSDLKALKDAATGANGAHIDAVQGIH